MYVTGAPQQSRSRSAVFVIDTATNTVGGGNPGHREGAVRRGVQPGWIARLRLGADGPLGLTVAAGVIDTATRTIVDDICDRLRGGRRGRVRAADRPRRLLRHASRNSDADLTALGFGDYVPIYDATLNTLGGCDHQQVDLDPLERRDAGPKAPSTCRSSPAATINGRVVGDGMLVKRGAGRLIAGWATATHAGGTRIEDGMLDGERRITPAP